MGKKKETKEERMKRNMGIAIEEEEETQTKPPNDQEEDEDWTEKKKDDKGGKKKKFEEKQKQKKKDEEEEEEEEKKSDDDAEDVQVKPEPKKVEKKPEKKVEKKEDKKPEKKVALNAFALLDDDDSGNTLQDDNDEDQEEEEEVIVKKKDNKKDNKKKPKEDFPVKKKVEEKKPEVKKDEKKEEKKVEPKKEEKKPEVKKEEVKKEEKKPEAKKEETKKPEAKKDDKKKPEVKKEEKKDDKKGAPNKKIPAHVAALREQLEKKKAQEEENRRRAIEEQRRIEQMERDAENERKKQEVEAEKKRREKNDEIKRLKAEGLLLTDKQKEEKLKQAQLLELAKKAKQEGVIVRAKKEKKEEVKVETNTKNDDDMSWEDLADVELKEEVKEEVKQVIEVKKEEKKDGEFRSPICCVLGHVDVGKTKILDKIRKTNVQDGEAGGITQQIGATFVPLDAIKTQTKALAEKMDIKYKIPGLLIIDTPGHESFTNLRTRGSSLCDIAILVVDILHGLENQTLESLELLRQRKTPFIVALNKVDTITEWKVHPYAPIQETLKKQGTSTMMHFREKVKETVGLFANQGINAALYYENDDPMRVLSLVPLSAITGEGLPDLLMLMTQLTQQYMSNKMLYKENLFQCTILEVKVISGLGTTIDAILTQGSIKESDQIVICTLNGPVVTNIRALLTPKPLKEIRVKGDYVHHKEVKAAQGIKICATDTEGTIPGSQILVVKPGDDVEVLKKEIMKDLESLLSHVSRVDRGVCVQASTLGSLEALLSFLASSNIPVMGINIGPVHRKDVVKCSTMVEFQPEYAVILAFDVPITKEALDMKDKVGVTIYSADIIYHLFDQFTAHMKNFREQKKREAMEKAFWPVELKIVDCFHAQDPITLGVDVVQGKLKVGTPLFVYQQEKGKEAKIIDIGKVVSIQHEKKAKTEAVRGSSCAIQLDTKLTYKRHFDDKFPVYTKITRDSIDVLREYFRDDVTQEEMLLLRELKGILDIGRM